MSNRLGSAAEPLWYTDAIIYELHVPASKDCNADGSGDFSGLIQKMDYLQDLGVTRLWLLPFFPSPLRNDGYDTADYLKVHPMYGTIDNFRGLLDAGHDRGLQVMIGPVVIHTSGTNFFPTSHSLSISTRRQRLALFQSRLSDTSNSRPSRATAIGSLPTISWGSNFSRGTSQRR